MIAVKVWCPNDEAQPEGLFNEASCPDAPPNWFREEPEYAAELYALERFAGKRSDIKVHVIDQAGTLHKFDVLVGYELTAHARVAD